MNVATDTADNIRITYYFIIPHPTEARILLMQDARGWSLPRFKPEQQHFANTQHINDALYEQLGVKAITIRCLHDNYSPVHDHIMRAYAMDILDKEWQNPSGSTWVSANDIAMYPLVSPQQAAMVRDWFAWVQTIDPNAVPWTHPGWYQQVAAWMVDVADRMDMVVVDRVQQARVWARACILYVDTHQGRLYFKAVPPMFSYEPVITRVLYLRYPQHIPDVRAVQVENGWMLMRAFEGRRLRETSNIAHWEKAVRTLAHIQRDLASSTQSFIGIGVPDRNVDLLVAQIDRLLTNLPDDLNKQERQLLRLAAPTLRTMSYELADYDMPLTLCHGDLSADNVIVTPDDDILFFDWSDSAVTHPFFDLPYLMMDAQRTLPDHANITDHLREIYLREWTRYGTMKSLQRAYQFGEILSPLYQAINYQRHILPHTEASAQWQTAHMLPFLLRRLLQAFRAYQR